MSRNFHKLLTILIGTLLLMSIGCEWRTDEEVYSWGPNRGSDREYSEPTPPNEDKLVISGYGQTLILEYNKLLLTAQIDWNDGNYYFAPDPDGSVGPGKTLCQANISDTKVEGKCYRQDQYCRFEFADGKIQSYNKNIYNLSYTNCQEDDELGIFFVPFDAPLYGVCISPACSDNDENSNSELTAVDHLINALCLAAERCNPTLPQWQCIGTFNQSYAGPSVPDWGNFGLTEFGTHYTSEQIREALDEGTILVDDLAFNSCIDELDTTCIDPSEEVLLEDIYEAETLIDPQGSCSDVLSTDTAVAL